MCENPTKNTKHSRCGVFRGEPKLWVRFIDMWTVSASDLWKENNASALMLVGNWRRRAKCAGRNGGALSPERDGERKKRDNFSIFLNERRRFRSLRRWYCVLPSSMHQLIKTITMKFNTPSTTLLACLNLTVWIPMVLTYSVSISEF